MDCFLSESLPLLRYVDVSKWETRVHIGPENGKDMANRETQFRT